MPSTPSVSLPAPGARSDDVALLEPGGRPEESILAGSSESAHDAFAAPWTDKAPSASAVAAPDLTTLSCPMSVTWEAASRPTGAGWTAGRDRVAAAGNPSPWYRHAKRAIDVAGAAALLVLFSPLMLAVWAILMVTTRGRPIFRQVRLGHCGRPFVMYKFRTMAPDALARQQEVRNEQEGPVFKNRRDPRITRFGRLLRRTSIDEMPQLFNVLVGQMSLVGPRPPLAQEVARYEPWQRRRLSVKPGLTCLWQVSGRSEIGFDEWVRMDLWYVENQRLWTDLTLLARTPASVIGRRGAY
jgi:lipopolysaccharide/colanic/teichoic acid biosynthesis glycosyltransferase